MERNNLPFVRWLSVREVLRVIFLRSTMKHLSLVLAVILLFKLVHTVEQSNQNEKLLEKRQINSKNCIFNLNVLFMFHSCD